jgi:hypothetical protein
MIKNPYRDEESFVPAPIVNVPCATVVKTSSRYLTYTK